MTGLRRDAGAGEKLFERDKFIALRAEHVDDLKCSICAGIIQDQKNPVTTMVTGFFIFLASKAIQILYRLCIRQKISALALSLLTFLCYN